MKRSWLLLLLLSFPLVGSAQEPIVIPPRATVVTTTVPAKPVVGIKGTILRLTVSSELSKTPVLWMVSNGLDHSEEAGNVLAIPIFENDAFPKSFSVWASASAKDGGKPVQVAYTMVTVVAPPPVPPGPVPPGPTPPGPTPPGPTPPPQPVTGLRVIFLRETGANHTREQLNILNSTAITAYLNAKTAKDAKGNPLWRRYDPDQQFAASEDASMKALFDAAKSKVTSLPALLIASDTKAELYQGEAFPATEAAALELLRKYGGN